jgi:hypothetical protein
MPESRSLVPLSNNGRFLVTAVRYIPDCLLSIVRSRKAHGSDRTPNGIALDFAHTKEFHQ